MSFSGEQGKRKLRFDSGRVAQGLFSNAGDAIGNTFRSIEVDKRIVLAIGFGIQDGPVPIRALAYIVPVMRLLAQLPSNTRVEFYVAVEGCIRANGDKMDPDVLRQRARAMAELLRKYVDRRYPEHADKVRILMDRKVDGDSAVENAMAALSGAAVAVYDEDETIRNFFKNRGGVETALRYGMEHMLYMRDPVVLPGDTPLLVDGMDFDFDHLVMIGGPSEHIFHRLRTAMLAKAGQHSRWTSHQLFSVIGKPPSYHYQVGEPTWDGLASLTQDPLELLRQTGRAVDKEMNYHIGVVWDLSVLLADAGRIAHFKEINPKRLYKGEETPPQDVESALRDGWTFLRSLTTHVEHSGGLHSDHAT